jgi:peptidoglycan/LPS O-acetylase OafA/YrhL
LGDARFSIYLFQVVSIALAANVVRVLPISGPLQLAAMIAACILASVAIGLAAHHLFERPLNRRLLQRRVRG